MSEIYTPGHNIFLDTLILNALVDLAQNLVEKVEGFGDSYRIRFSKPLDNVAQVVVNNAKGINIDVNISNLLNFKAIQKQESVQIKVKKAFETLRNLNEIRAYLHDLTAPGHSLRKNEGRRKSKGALDTVYLHTSPYLGKYLTHFYSYDVISYTACTLCRALSLHGLLRTYILSGGPNSFIIVPAFIGFVKGKDLVNLINYVNPWRTSRLTQYLGTVLDKIDTRNFIYLTFTNLSYDLLKALVRSNASWFAISIKFKIRRTQEVRGFNTIQLDPLIDFLSLLSKEEHEKLLETLESITLMLRYDETSSESLTVINSMFKAFIDKDVDSFYNFVRSYEVLKKITEVKLRKVIPSLNMEFTKNLIKSLAAI